MKFLRVLKLTLALNTSKVSDLKRAQPVLELSQGFAEVTSQ